MQLSKQYGLAARLLRAEPGLAQGSAGGRAAGSAQPGFEPPRGAAGAAAHRRLRGPTARCRAAATAQPQPGPFLLPLKPSKLLF